MKIYSDKVLLGTSVTALLKIILKMLVKGGEKIFQILQILYFRIARVLSYLIFSMQFC